jgi:hypothetical protein
VQHHPGYLIGADALVSDTGYRTSDLVCVKAAPAATQYRPGRQRGCCHWRPGLSSRPVAMGSGSAPHRSGSLPWLREWTTHSTDANIAYQADRCLRSNSPAPEASRGSPRNCGFPTKAGPGAAVERAQFPPWSAKTISHDFGSDDGAV